MLCILEYKGAIDDTLTPAELVTLRIMKNLYHPYIPTLIIDIYGKIEIDVVCPLKPLFYSRYVDDIYNRHRKDEYDQVFSALNNYHDTDN